MRVRLSFTLPEEEQQMHDALQGGAAKSLLWTIDQMCRSVAKYESDPDPGRLDLAQQIRQTILQEHGVSLE
jgi:hypothetical protein